MKTALADKPRDRPKDVQKVDLRTSLTVKEIQENPELGAYRVEAALEQVDIHLGMRTVGRILKMSRETYGLGKPARSPDQKKQSHWASMRLRAGFSQFPGRIAGSCWIL